MVAPLGRVRLKFVEAVYEKEHVQGPVSTFCDAMILEKSKWRRRRSKQRGAAAGEDPLHPVWNEEYEVDGVRADCALHFKCSTGLRSWPASEALHSELATAHFSALVR
jgi:hypothetical protein